jgi:molecular chaperone GrpE
MSEEKNNEQQDSEMQDQQNENTERPKDESEINEEVAAVQTGQSSGVADSNELELLQKRCDEYLNGWKRAKADYINLKKETEKHQLEMIQFANAALLAQLIPIYDHFKKAFSHVPHEQKDSSWVFGIEQIYKQMQSFLNNLGIEEIKTVGEIFDPSRHEAVEKKKMVGKKEQEILEEVSPGYTLHGKVLNPAKVVVNG